MAAKLFHGIYAHMVERDLLLYEGTMVDATIVAATYSTKNKEYAHDPEMHRTKKGNEWHFGVKANINADADSGHVYNLHNLHTTAGNESGVAQHDHQDRREHAQDAHRGAGGHQDAVWGPCQASVSCGQEPVPSQEDALRGASQQPSTAAEPSGPSQPSAGEEATHVMQAAAMSAP